MAAVRDAKADALMPDNLVAATDTIRSRIPNDLKTPKFGIVCGSGLSTLGSSLVDAVSVPYSAIPGFSQSSVQGHQNSLTFGFISSQDCWVPVVAALGRFHLYEGHQAQQAVFPVRVFRALGCETVVITNASGGLNPSYSVGTILALQDHLSLPTVCGPMNPLIGPNFPMGPRFPATSNAYDPALRLAFFQTAQEMGLVDVDSPEDDEKQAVREGIYAFVTGPSYESRAECKMLRALGADCVGMSTVPEILAAHQCGLRVLALSLITNKVVITPYSSSFQALRHSHGSGPGNADAEEAANHEEVLAVGAEKAGVMRQLVEGTILRLSA